MEIHCDALDRALERDETLEPELWPGPAREGPLRPFLHLATPVVAPAYAQLRQTLRNAERRYPSLRPVLSGLEPRLVGGLRVRLEELLARTLTLELHVQGLEGNLPGAGARERFERFVELLRLGAYRRSLFEEYPILARALSRRVEDWLSFSRSFAQHLVADWDALHAAFADWGELGTVAGLEPCAGDAHRGGRSVAILEFSSGRRLVYKPRPLDVERHYQDLLRFLNRRGAEPAFRTLQVLSRSDHGWVEFAESRACRSEPEVRRFYRRMGGQLAVLYVLRATDFHSGNVVAEGEHPVPIDLETLFHPRMRHGEVRDASGAALELLGDSVLSVGLLPYVQPMNQTCWIDFSAIGASGAQITLSSAPAWVAEGTDQMRLAYGEKKVRGPHCRPELKGEPVDATRYADEICAGFSACYELILREREALLDAEGPIRAFGRDEVRYVLRPTHEYARLLRESCHPDLLRDALDRDRVFDHLWGRVAAEPHLARVVESERAQLERGDVPVFLTSPRTVDVRGGDGSEIGSLLQESGLHAVLAQLRRLGDADRERQLDLIRASFATARTAQPGAPWPRSNWREASRGGTPSEYLEAAVRLGDRLERTAIAGAGEVSWLALVPANAGPWRLLPVGLDLYRGLPGIALFLAYLGEVSGERRYTDLARGAVRTLRSQLRSLPDRLGNVGAFDGWGGVYYALSHLAALWGSSEPLEPLEPVTRWLPEGIRADERLDIVGGCAGLVAGLLALPRSFAPERTRELLRRCGEHLAARARRGAVGCGWVVPGAGEQPLAGFSHGSAGFAWSLEKIAERCEEPRFARLAEQARTHERSLYDAERRNWPDGRERAGAEDRAGARSRDMVAWCHGAAGVGLARLASLKAADGAEVRREIAVAVQTTLQRGFGSNHSLCHGEMGNLDFVLEASLQLGDGALRRRVHSAARGVLDAVAEHGWLCGVPLAAECPGLMTGLAGIGYGLLRLAAPERVSSVLGLAPPHGCA